MEVLQCLVPQKMIEKSSKVPKVLIVALLVSICLLSGVEGRSTRSGDDCTDDDHKEMTLAFQHCLEKFTKEHHEASGKATKPEEYQEFTCKLLSDTVDCGALWEKCHSSEEVRNIQDTHIQARISQFRDNSDGIDVLKCPLAKEYIESGRADQVDESTEGACSRAEVNMVQEDFQKCSQNKSIALYESIQKLQEARYERDTNDLDSEFNQEESEDDLDPLKDIKPHVCKALTEIATDCVDKFGRCFSKDDSKQIQSQHVKQLQAYYAQIYEGVGDLSNCPGLIKLEKQQREEEEDEDDENENENEDEYEDDYSENYDYSDEEEDDDSSSSSSSTGSSTLQGATSAEVTSSSSGYSYKDSNENHYSNGNSVMDYEISQYPDPEGNAVIAEPPSFIDEGHSSGYKTVSLGTLTVLCLTLSAFFGQILTQLCH